MTHSTPDPRKPWRNYRHAIRAHERLLRPDERMHASEPRLSDREAYRRKVLDAAAIGDDAFLQAELDKRRLTEEQIMELRKNAKPIAEWPDEDVDALLGLREKCEHAALRKSVADDGGGLTYCGECGAQVALKIVVDRPSWFRRVIRWFKRKVV